MSRGVGSGVQHVSCCVTNHPKPSADGNDQVLPSSESVLGSASLGWAHWDTHGELVNRVEAGRVWGLPSHVRWMG